MAKTPTDKIARKTPVRRARKTTAPATGAPVADISAEAIAQRAFEVYCARGGAPGSELEDWLQAERELKSTASPAG